jgi:peptidoglycan/xylan/chitin deacetylase (PgdA/CDA1 family)
MPIPILLYHQIDEPADRGTPFRYLTVTPRNFYRQMKWLKRLGWTGLSMRDLRPYLQGERVGKVVGITFDDGFHSVYANALPVLEEFGFSATAYFVSRQVGGFNAWDAAVGVPYAACMSKEEILEWSGLGHEVGAHTQDHVHLTAIAPHEARRQIAEARFELEDIVGNEVDAFCYPYGQVTNKIRSMVEEAGYSSATTTRSGRAQSPDDMLLLPRILLCRTDGALKVLRKCTTG